MSIALQQAQKFARYRTVVRIVASYSHLPPRRLVLFARLPVATAAATANTIGTEVALRGHVVRFACPGLGLRNEGSKEKYDMQDDLNLGRDVAPLLQ